MRGAVRNKERGEKGAVRLPKILVLTCVPEARVLPWLFTPSSVPSSFL